MAGFKPSQVFASVSSPPRKQLKMEDIDFENITPLTNVKVSDRYITVNAMGEVSLPPDRCKLTLRINSQKENVEEVKTSVTRRVDYVLQTLYNHSIKESDIKMYKTIRRVEGLFSMEAEIQAIFADQHKCQTVANLLVEKLDETVTVCLPEFYHASTTMQNLRQQASLLAIHNAKLKAQEMAKFVHQNVGQPISIAEEETKEWQGSQDTPTDIENTKTVQQRLTDSTVTVSCKVSVRFELKPKVKTKAVR
ncbi:interleukin-1 receptor-associated kinase 1-binding protein 1-like [Ylistrum balloti]|uniref:interleukin-1 receptor-associated kinase 1-binding protein 1-like n=1 Tax=Ylistrum balloti TaxID=509963 RepID=UPI002905A85A|nr:interleukin-1 receptor-associated kinase 1-binding protein 1-like [Ylistrum balloti]